MLKFDVTIVFVAVIVAAGMFVSASVAPHEMRWPDIHSDPISRIFLGIGTIASLPFAFAMPRIKVGFFGQMGRSWRVPSESYMMPHWVIRLAIGSFIGQVAAGAAIGIFQDHSYYSFAGMALLTGGAFCAGAWGRLKKGPRAEFTMRWWPR